MDELETRDGFSFLFKPKPHWTYLPTGLMQRMCHGCALRYYTESDNGCDNREVYPRGWGGHGGWLYCGNCFPCAAVGGAYG